MMNHAEDRLSSKVIDRQDQLGGERDLFRETFHHKILIIVNFMFNCSNNIQKSKMMMLEIKAKKTKINRQNLFLK